MNREIKVACITEELPWFWERIVLAAQEKGVTLFVESHNGFQMEFLKFYQFLWVNPDFSDLIVPNITVIPESIRACMVLDSFVSDGKQMYPRNLFLESIHETLVKEIKHLDIRQCAYVVGSNKWAKAAVVALIRLGYETIFICDEDSEKVEIMTTELRQRYFGVEVRALNADDLTAATTPGSILFNCALFGSDPMFQINVLYLNYLSDSSVIIDWAHPEEKSALMEEGKRAQLRTLSGERIFNVYLRLVLEALGI